MLCTLALCIVYVAAEDLSLIALAIILVKFMTVGWTPCTKKHDTHNLCTYLWYYTNWARQSPDSSAVLISGSPSEVWNVLVKMCPAQWMTSYTVLTCLFQKFKMKFITWLFICSYTHVYIMLNLSMPSGPPTLVGWEGWKFINISSIYCTDHDKRV